MTVKSTVGWGFGIIVILLIVYVGFKIYVPGYEVLKEDFIDAPYKAQIDMRVLFPHKVTEKKLRGLLNKLYSTVKDRRFKYRDKPTHVFIDIYTSRQKFESVDWVASLQKIGSDAEPAILINKRQMALYKDQHARKAIENK